MDIEIKKIPCGMVCVCVCVCETAKLTTAEN